MPIASNSAETAYAEICREKLDTSLERTDNNYCLQTPQTGGEIIPEPRGAIISEQWGGFIGIGMALAQGQWLTAHEGLIITGHTGTGKSWLACAFGRQAARLGHSVLYVRVPRMFEDLALARLDGSFPRLIDKLTRIQLLILDDFGTHALSDQQRFHLFEIVEERYQRKSTLITAQVPVASWHDLIADSTVADAILDRIVHNAHRITLRGESMRKQKSAPLLTDAENGEINQP